MPLEDIQHILKQRNFDALSALEGHRAELGKRTLRLERLRATVDKTIRHLKGNEAMSEIRLFDGFSEEQQAQLEKRPCSCTTRRR